MTNNPAALPLNVSLADRPAQRVAFLRYQTHQTAGNYDRAIRDHFEQIKAWVQAQGADTTAVPAIGIAQVVEGQLQAYECCIPIPAELPVNHPHVRAKIIPGGKYAVVHIAKQGALIGATIGRFFQEYVPSAQLQFDHARPTYEVYWGKTLDFCVPVLA